MSKQKTFYLRPAKEWGWIVMEVETAKAMTLDDIKVAGEIAECVAWVNLQADVYGSVTMVVEGDQSADRFFGRNVGQTEYQNPAPAKNPFRYNGGR